MTDERTLYRVQWPTLRRRLYDLCLRQYGHVLFAAFCAAELLSPDLQTAINAWRQAILTDPKQRMSVNRSGVAINAWRQAILTDLAQRARPAAAWPGWAALMPLFSDSTRLYTTLAQQAQAIQQACASGRTDVLWNTLYAYFTISRDALDGARTTRLQVWRRLDRLRHAWQRQRQRQGLEECHDPAELAAHVLLMIERQALKDAPRTVEGVLSYFYEFDPAYTEPYEEELHNLAALEACTGSDWQRDLERCLAALPADLRQAIDVSFTLHPQPVCRTDEEFRAYYGCSRRTMRQRAARALQHLRAAMEL